MIDGYCKVGRIDEALEVFDEFRKTSILSLACYNTIINGLCKNGMTEMAIEALLELNHEGLELDPGTFRMLMKTIFEENNTKEAVDLIYRMEGLGPDIYSAVCNDFIFFFLCQRGLLDDANHMWMMMKKKGLYVTCNSYYSILRGHLNNKNREQILPLLNCFLKDYGLEPMVHTIIACYLCLKDVNSALIFLGKTVNNSSTVTFLASTLKIFIKESRALDAYRLVTETQDHLPVMYAD